MGSHGEGHAPRGAEAPGSVGGRAQSRGPRGRNPGRKNRGIRTERYKLIHFFEQPEEWELYDLAADPDETVNLAGKAEHRTLMAQLRERMERLRRELGDTDPPGPPPISAPCDLPA